MCHDVTLAEEKKMPVTSIKNAIYFGRQLYCVYSNPWCIPRLAIRVQNGRAKSLRLCSYRCPMRPVDGRDCNREDSANSREKSLEERAASYLAGVKKDLATTTWMPKEKNGLWSSFDRRLGEQTFTHSSSIIPGTATVTTGRGTWCQEETIV